ncbi:MAG: hypothetical protein RQ743_14430, partial [Bacteroidales bacterium]|nr:hypothetical protein [Bacteroidales bacterium]
RKYGMKLKLKQRIISWTSPTPQRTRTRRGQPELPPFAKSPNEVTNSQMVPNNQKAQDRIMWESTTLNSAISKMAVRNTIDN